MVAVQLRPARPSITEHHRKLYYGSLPARKPAMSTASTHQAAFTNTSSDVSSKIPTETEQRGNATGGLLDLERELTCSICTEILYQPLTLLNCLHTFCGGCLKEWFKWQGISAAQKHIRDHGHSAYSRIPNPYTCPSCRATVRETRPNATVTSLLDMWLSANPTKGRNEAERKETDHHYTRGENVIPDVRDLLLRSGLRNSSGSEELREGLADRRDVPEERNIPRLEARQRTGVDISSGYNARRSRERAGISYTNPRQNGEAEEQELERRRRRRDRSEQSRRRVLEHQNSLRSLLGLGDTESLDIEAEILRQITEDGLLEGMDLSNMDPSQEDELSERIAQAFRRRQRERQRERRSQSAQRRPTSSQSQAVNDGRRSGNESRRSESETPMPMAESHVIRAGAVPPRDDRASERDVIRERQSRPPVSRPRLLEAATNSMRPERRSSSQGSAARARALDTEALLQQTGEAETVGRFSSDLAVRVPSREGVDDPTLRATSRERRATNPEVRNISDTWRTGGVSAVSRPNSSRGVTGTTSQPYTGMSRRASNTSLHHEGTDGTSKLLAASSGQHSVLLSDRAPSTGDSIAVSRPGTALSDRSALQSRMSDLICESCKKHGMQQDLHYICRKCSVNSIDSPYTLCLRCYRRGKGCKHWFGFGTAAKARYERRAPPNGYPPGHEQPHIMSPERYISKQGSSDASRADISNSAPVVLEHGPFCDSCLQNANSCYWHCDACNEGEWGYCNICVNQARHCSHALLSFKKSSESIGAPDPNMDLTNLNAAMTDMKPFVVPTQCSNCLKHILFTQARFHCPTCDAGNYDLCTPCYNTMVTNGQISLRNGPQGWRRCPQGHRMLVIGFDESKPDRRRIVLEGIVGGWALHDSDDTTTASQTQSPSSGPTSTSSVVSSIVTDRSEGNRTPPGLQRWSWRETDTGSGWKHKKRPGRRNSDDNGTTGTGGSTSPTSGGGTGLKDIPPSGGQGMRMLALWSRVLDDGVHDELSFPRGAVIEEVVDINGDWCWGVYCRRTGLFPGGWARVL